MKRIFALLVVLIAILPALAQDQPDAEAEKSALLTFIEEQLSAPNRRISLSNIDGVLSSDARIGTITIADREGVWLTVSDAAIIWTRTALFLGRLEIDSLTAKSIEMARRPLPDENAMPSPEAASFSVPDLPLAVNLGELTVESLTFGEGVFGLASRLGLEGRLSIDGGALSTGLEITRLDGPGGKLDLEASYANATGTLDLDMSLSEPADGVVANLFNFHDRPAVNLGLRGGGPVDDLKLALTLDADDSRVLTGQMQVSGGDAGRRFNIGAAGPVGTLVRPDLRDLFGERSELVISGVTRADGGADIERIMLSSGALELNGSARTAADGFPLQMNLDGTIQSRTGQPVTLPLPGGDTTVNRAVLAFDFGGSDVSTWSGNVTISDFATAGVTARDFELDLGGAALALADPAAREVTFVVDGRADGLGAEDAALAEAIGDRAGIDISGAWKAGQPVTIDRAVLDTNVLSADFAGRIAEFVLDGAFGLNVSDASVLSAALERELAGAAALKATGTVNPVTGAFDLALDGTVEDFATDTAIDGLLAGTTRVGGRAGRGETGLSARDFSIANPQFSFNADGVYGSETADFRFASEITELSRLSDQVSGRLVTEGSARGTDGVIDLRLTAKVPSGTIVGRRLNDATVSFVGQSLGEGISGDLDGLAFVGGERVDVKTALALGSDGRRFDNLEINAGATRLAGSLAAGADGLFDGMLELRSNDISTVAALALVQATGRATGEITLSAADGRQDARLAAQLTGVRIDETAIGAGEIDIALSDLYGVPGADGRATLNDVRVAGMDTAALTATASQRGSTTDFETDARLANGATLAAAGAIAGEGDGYRLTLNRADIDRDGRLAHLAAPATATFTGGGITLDGARFEIGGGTINASGRAGDVLDFALEVERVGLAVANAIRPDLELDGRVSGDLKVSGTRQRPQVAFDLDGDGLSAAATQAAGLPAFAVTARGDTDGEKLRLDARLSSGNGISATADGTVPLGDGALAVDVALQSLPLALLDRAAGGQGLGGQLTGTARVTGTLSRPEADFALSGEGVRATALSDAGIAALGFGANGSFAGNVVTLSSFNASGPSGLEVTGSGRVPIDGPGLNLSLAGSAPLSLANRQLASRGAQAGGTARFTLALSGALANPAIRGQIATEGATYADPGANIALRNIAVAADLDGERITIRRGAAGLVAGGSVSLAGAVSLDGLAGYPADLTVNLDQARYTDGSLVVATVSGRMAVTGALIYDPLISGSLTVERAELTIPETLGAVADGIDVKHINPPAKVTRTLEFARADDGTPVPSGRPSVARLNLSVNAPNRIFVRGRGLDSELGGTVRLTGPVTAIQPVGGFRLIRGRLSILGKRIVFNDGEVTLVGDLDPFIDFTARSETSDTTVIIKMTGRISDPAIVFSSQPELPQDEVLSRLIFGRSITELTALQLAKLAASAAQLAGGGNSSLLGSFRQATGLDELDVVTDSGGNAAVRAGRYVQDNIYLGVEAGASGTTRGTVNIDITDNLRARGSAGSDGDSSVGIFFEKDY